MCQLFTNSDRSVWKSKSRSIRVDGVVTSVRLETFFWETLEEIGHRDNLSVGRLITKLYKEARDAEHDLTNFTSYLRVCCGRYLSLSADRAISRSDKTHISSLPSMDILSAEKKRRQDRARTYNERLSHLISEPNGADNNGDLLLSDNNNN